MALLAALRTNTVERQGINFETESEKDMSYAIVGFGKIGQALAHAFARKNIEVSVASRRPPEVLGATGSSDWTQSHRQVAAGCT